MPATKERCITSGEYVSQCGCATRLAMNAGMFFPSCYRCDKRVVWELMDADRPERRGSP